MKSFLHTTLILLGLIALTNSDICAMNKLKNSRTPLTPLEITTLPSSAPALQEISTDIKITLHNYLPDGVLIRSIYKEHGAKPLYFFDQKIDLPGTYNVTIQAVKRGADSTTLRLKRLQCLDLPSKTVIKELSRHQLFDTTEPLKINLMRTKKTGKTQLPPLEKTPDKKKTTRRSPTDILDPIIEKDENEEAELPLEQPSPSSCLNLEALALQEESQN